SLLDQSAAFDAVVHNILLQLLLNGESSSHTEVNYEAPQASVQRPRAFSLHIMSFNFLLLSSDKTEVIVTGRKNLRNTVANKILTLDIILQDLHTLVLSLAGVIGLTAVAFVSEVLVDY
uniref:Uncharacterized protein n=1 Tax=Oreochromis aureus TaxID=47969 RepID=A0AAZ1XZP5_OREAU